MSEWPVQWERRNWNLNRPEERNPLDFSSYHRVGFPKLISREICDTVTEVGSFCGFCAQCSPGQGPTLRINIILRLCGKLERGFLPGAGEQISWDACSATVRGKAVLIQTNNNSCAGETYFPGDSLTRRRRRRRRGRDTVTEAGSFCGYCSHCPPRPGTRSNFSNKHHIAALRQTWETGFLLEAVEQTSWDACSITVRGKRVLMERYTRLCILIRSLLIMSSPAYYQSLFTEGSQVAKKAK